RRLARTQPFMKARNRNRAVTPVSDRGTVAAVAYEVHVDTVDGVPSDDVHIDAVRPIGRARNARVDLGRLPVEVLAGVGDRVPFGMQRRHTARVLAAADGAAVHPRMHLNIRLTGRMREFADVVEGVE